MKLRDLSFFVIVCFAVGGTQFLSHVNKPPKMPGDASHRSISGNHRSRCLQCHGEDFMAAIERKGLHPVRWRDARTDCTLCHTVPDGIELVAHSKR